MRNRVIGRMIALFDSIGLDVQRTVSSRSGRRFTFADLVNEAFEGD
jgi:DNA-directed RNA polymerase specialized sigma24 family protein